MPSLIDTDLLIDHLDDKPDAIALLTRLADDGIAMSIISYMELYQGVVESPNPEEAALKLSRLVASTPILPFSLEAAETCSRIRADLKRQGRRVQPRALDLQIAATAIAHGLVLVTHNLDDFSDIPGIALYHFDRPLGR